MAGPSIVNISPISGATGVPVKIDVEILFDREVDETAALGGFVVFGPDYDTLSGPDLTRWIDTGATGNEDVLTSPSFKGRVVGTITFERINPSDEGEYTGYDYQGIVTSYRSKLIFTSEKILSPLAEHTVYTKGDSLDSEDNLVGYGIRTRTVFDTQSGTNLGTGRATIYGGYRGTTTDKYVVEITYAGERGVAVFEWYKNSTPLAAHSGITSMEAVELEDGVFVSFTEGTYSLGDKWEAVVKNGESMTGGYKWTFTTGSGSITAAYTGQSSFLTGTNTVSTGDALSVTRISPRNRSTNLDPNQTRQIIVTFSNTLDVDSLDATAIEVETFPVDGYQHEATPVTYQGKLRKNVTVSDNKLIIDI